MKDRIAQILRTKNITATQFADELNVQRSGISHILSGRNNPSLDFIIKIKETYPEFNLDWLITGKGPATGIIPVKESKVETARAEQIATTEPDLFSETVRVEKIEVRKEVIPEVAREIVEAEPGFLGHDNIKKAPLQTKRAEYKEVKKVVKLLMVYDDFSFDSFEPNNA